MSSPRQVRWVSLTETFNVEFTHIPGVTNTASNALSRLDHSLMPILMPDTVEDWSADYQSQQGGISGLSPWTEMTAEALTTFHRGKYWHDDRILVPDSRIGEIITWYHDAMTAGHWGARKTHQILQRKYIFNNMKEAVDLHVRTCNICQRVKSERRSAREKIQPLPIPERK